LEFNFMRKLSTKLSAIAFIVMMTAPLPAIAYTQQDADACTPDAFRLCQQAIPDATRITLCLAQNKLQLSPACALVFKRPRAASAASAAHERPATVQNTKF
jgi:hypothetical protein